MRTLLLFAAVLCGSAAAEVKEPFFFIQASDPQFGFYARNADLSQESANFEFLVATANRLRPAFVVVTGDLVNRASHPAQVPEYKRIAAKLDPSIPLYSIPGNHDIGDVVAPDHLENWRRSFGRDYYTVRHGGAAFFMLNSGLVLNPQRVPGEAEKQEAWLRDELARARKDGIRTMMVFQHHPWFLSSPDEPDQYNNVPADRRARYLDLFREYGVTHVFAGHLHRNVSARAGALEMIVSGAIGLPRGHDRSGFRVVVVRPDGVEHQYYDLGNVPNRIPLKPEPAKTR